MKNREQDINKKLKLQMSIITADKLQRTDGSAAALLEKLNVGIPIVLVAWTEDFQFNPELLNIKGDWLLCCFCEYGYDWSLNKSGSHIWGKNSENFPRYYNNDWIKFDDWVKENPPTLILKRELLKRDESKTVKPVEYPLLYEIPEPDTKEQFDNRVFNVMFYWGRSNEERLRVHSEIWMNAYKTGGAVCDNVYYINSFAREEKNKDKWLTLNIPHYERLQMAEFIKVNALAKISISMAGAGLRCFRHSESPSNSVMAMAKDNLAWNFNWDETNSIQFENGKEIETIVRELKNPNLHQIYLKGIETCRNYYLPNYVKHLEKTIIGYA